MAANVWIALTVTGSALAAVIVLDCVVRVALHRFTSLMPDTLCGPDGWLIDTTRHCGVFDKRVRR